VTNIKQNYSLSLPRHSNPAALTTRIRD
jgi:hypothetical protein